MNRDDCLCLACLSHLSQPQNKKIITSSCATCGKTLIARATPGYQLCQVCSTLENRCACCGEPLSKTPNEIQLTRFIRKLSQSDSQLLWQYDEVYQCLTFQLSKGMGQLYLQEMSEFPFHLQLALTSPIASGSTLYTYDCYLSDPCEALPDIQFYQTHWEELMWLTQKGFTYDSRLTSTPFSQLFWDAPFTAQFTSLKK